MPYKEPVDSVMTQAVQAIAPDQTVEDAQWLLLEFDIHHVPVTQEGRLVGLVTSTDILRHRSTANGNGYSDLVDTIMQRDLITLRQNDTLGEAARVMATGNLHCAPVVDEGGDLVGIVTSTDLIAYLHQHAG